MKDIVKAALWGLALLISLIYLFVNLAFIYLSITDRCQLTEEKINILVAKVSPIVESLATHYPGEESKYDYSFGENNHPQSKEANRAINRITSEICPGTHYYEFDIQEIFSPKGKLELLQEYQHEKLRILEYNLLNTWLKFIGGCIGLLVGSIFLFRLTRFKRFNVKSNAFYLLSCTPIILVAFSMGMIWSDLSLNVDNLDKVALLILISFVWIFLVYPAIYILAKKQGGLKAILFPPKG